MRRLLCQLLDDYLAGEVDDATCRRFESHLKGCHDCRQEVELQRSIDASLVTANARVELPAALVDRIEQRILAAWRLRRALMASAAAAAMLLTASVVAVGIQLRRTGGRAPVPQNGLVRQPMDDTHAATQRVAKVPRDDRHVEVSFPASHEIIAVEYETRDPTVTLLMVYPIIRPELLEDLVIPHDSENGGQEL